MGKEGFSVANSRNLERFSIYLKTAHLLLPTSPALVTAAPRPPHKLEKSEGKDLE